MREFFRRLSIKNQQFFLLTGTSSFKYIYNSLSSSFYFEFFFVIPKFSGKPIKFWQIF